jgi:hypothetical protein
MGKTILIGRCIFCDSEFETIDKRKKFCNSSCAAKYNNRKRKIKESSKKKTSESLKKYFDENPRFKKPKKEFFWAGIKTSQHRFLKNPKNLYELSSRTRIKILERLEISCSQCDWNDCIGDLHHIKGRKIEDCHNHNNLSYLCPNCHRLVHNDLIPIENLITMEEQIGDKWKKYYYG